ncbi:response regulator transcription factor [Neolewinella aurantiaca]|uniref:Response regulator transcription factor n=1 Tax=Neolewinella aurantiaca TaxID=2602767 RepID=A0A5C7FY42_9BACT|nr:LytTR family DNA-binding domain-containing protein [Neolewinella aurantiaca]TXF89950.1 response regulator transcription factor [Neolewinella aurantiaca]
MRKEKLKSIVVDDEASSRENILILLEEFCPDVNVAGVASSVKKAAELIEDENPQLVFLDIQLGTETAFTLLEQLNEISFEIIFVTAYDRFAIRAFEFMAISYLLKPIDVDKLTQAVDSAVKRVGVKSFHVSMEEMVQQVRNFNRKQHKIALSTEKGYEMVHINEITYCVANGSYTNFHFKSGSTITVSKNLKYYERLLEDYDFFRSHTTALINLLYVKRIDRSDGGSLVMEDDCMLPVSKARRKELEALIKEKRRLI